MLSQMTREEFDERMAADVLDPIDDTWEQAGTIASSIVNAIQTALAGYAGKKLTKGDYQQPTDYIPLPKFLAKKHEKQRRKSRRMSPEEEQARAKAQYGNV